MPWSSWLGRRQDRSPDREVVVLTREGCHLCADMLGVVEAASGGATVWEVDVDRALAEGTMSAAEHEGWTSAVPVLLVDGREVARYRVDADQARRAIRGR